MKLCIVFGSGVFGKVVSAFVVVSGQQFSTFEGLHAGSANTSGILTVVLPGDTVSFLSTIFIGQSAYTDCGLDVKLSDNRGCSGVEPIFIIRSQFVVASGFDKVDPTGEFDLVRLLKEFSIGTNEVSC